MDPVVFGLRNLVGSFEVFNLFLTSFKMYLKATKLSKSTKVITESIKLKTTSKYEQTLIEWLSQNRVPLLPKLPRKLDRRLTKIRLPLE